MPEEHVTDQPSAGSGHLPALPSSLAGTMTNYVVKRYAPEHKHEWDKFVSTGKNATFLFRRDYMDYHNERFTDHSLMVFHKGRLVALLPANLRADGSLASHDGLTYGGLVVSKSATLSNMLASLFWVLCHLHQQGITRLFYKRIPSFYNTVTDGEVDYALFLLGAQLCRRDNAMVIKQAGRLAFRKGRKSEVSKARRAGVRVVEEDGFGPFWKRVLIPRLASQYGVTPVHTLDEITLLAARFPDYIKQFSAYCDGEVVAGATVSVLMLLVAAPLAIALLSRLGNPSEMIRKELWARYFSWLILVPLMAAPILLGAAYAMVAVGILSLLCYREYARATGLFRERSISAVVVVGIILITLASLDNWYELFTALWPLTVGLIAAIAILADRPSGYVQRVGLGVLGYMLFGAGLGHLGFFGNDPQYRRILIWILLCVELNDIFAFICGKSFGRKKLAPCLRE